ncbi:MAG TPA: DNA polymerase III subunit gamma/tau [Actinomycetota bacterium]|nr:DNA polymerase III subunit gamma/tau [Actinomycetota bacterium]
MAEDTGYQSLYRKYRPQAPDEVIGQDHVVRALVGAVRENRLSHAFLFTGPRGTGKTSTARILARMVNCDKGPTAEPDGTCEQCLRIKDGTHLDVVEIDAASHGGVDDARELRERAPTAPAMGREKVYIIDEAQRLSREAFDALLKVFEEPPPAVRFILATTEPHKMPPTIVGRCQRFDFRRVPTEAVADHLERVAKEEGMVLTRPAAEALARQSEGSVRDALSLLDQSAVLGGGEINEEVIASLIGAPASDVQFELADAIAVHDSKAVFEIVHRLVQGGQDFRHLTGLVIGHFRDLLLVRSSPDDPGLLDVPPELHGRMAGQGGKFTSAELSRILSLLLAAQTDMRWTTSPRLTLELALIRATIPEADPTPAGLAARIERLERLAGVEETVRTPEPGGTASAGHSPPFPRSGDTAGHLAAPAPSTPPEADGSAKPDVTQVDTDSSDSDESEATPHAPSTSTLDLQTIRRSWQQLLDRLLERRKMILRANLESVTAAAFDGDTLELAFPPGRKFAVGKVQSKEEELREVFAEVFGVSPRIVCAARDDVPGLVTEEDDPPATREDAVARLKAELGAEVEE